MSKLWRLANEELHRLNFRLLFMRATLAPLPAFVGSRLRAELLRRAGFSIGAGTMFWGNPKITGTGKVHEKLSIGAGCWFNIDCYFEAGDEIRIGDDISFGPEVMILTTSHELDGGSSYRRASGVTTRPVVVENGAWLGARSTVLPGVVVGRGAVVAAGAVVNRDVAPNSFVGGVPARVIKTLT